MLPLEEEETEERKVRKRMRGNDELDHMYALIKTLLKQCRELALIEAM